MNQSRGWTGKRDDCAVNSRCDDLLWMRGHSIVRYIRQAEPVGSSSEGKLRELAPLDKTRKIGNWWVHLGARKAGMVALHCTAMAHQICV